MSYDVEAFFLIIRKSLILRWYRKWDLNPHALTDTRF